MQRRLKVDSETPPGGACMALGSQPSLCSLELAKPSWLPRSWVRRDLGMNGMISSHGQDSSPWAAGVKPRSL